MIVKKRTLYAQENRLGNWSVVISLLSDQVEVMTANNCHQNGKSQVYQHKHEVMQNASSVFSGLIVDGKDEKVRTNEQGGLMD